MSADRHFFALVLALSVIAMLAISIWAWADERRYERGRDYREVMSRANQQNDALILWGITGDDKYLMLAVFGSYPPVSLEPGDFPDRCGCPGPGGVKWSDAA